MFFVEPSDPNAKCNIMPSMATVYCEKLAVLAYNLDPHDEAELQTGATALQVEQETKRSSPAYPAIQREDTAADKSARAEEIMKEVMMTKPPSSQRPSHR